MYRVGVISGGPSFEHEVSLRTGRRVHSLLSETELLPVEIHISKSGEWLSGGKVWQPHDLLKTIDVAFNALHGAYGEDGRIQRLFEAHGVPYTGSRAFPSALAINKALTKDHVTSGPFRLAPHLYASQELSDYAGFAAAVAESFPGPYVVKPVCGGSSVDTTIVASEIELASVLESLLARHEYVMIEKKIVGKEVTVGVLSNFREQDTYALPPIEISLPGELFDYESKYSDTTQKHCPGRFSLAEKEALMEAAIFVHRHLGLSQYSRSDFLIADDGLYFLEVNTLPGLTEQSLFPQALDAVGVSQKGFVTHLIFESLKHTPQRVIV